MAQQATKQTARYFLKSHEVRKLLGIGQTKYYELIHSGKLPHYRVGNRIRVKSTDLNSWIENNKNGG